MTTVEDQIEAYIASQSEPKQTDLRTLHGLILEAMPACRLWFLDGTDSEGKVVSNPSIGYGVRTIDYADGKSREFYQIGLSANKTGLSVYILGIKDKAYLAQTYGATLGQASVTGYCIKFRALEKINVDGLVTAIRDGVALTS